MTSQEKPTDTDTGETTATTTDINSQENVAPRHGQPPSRHSSKAQVRHRASVACASCRDRRIRCVVPQGQAECNQCRRTGTDCVIKNDDERRRPISKAYMSSLSDRIVLLENMLADQGLQPPPALHPPKTKQEPQSKADESGKESSHSSSNNGNTKATKDDVHSILSPSHNVPSPPDSGNEDYMIRDNDTATDTLLSEYQSFQPAPKEDSPFRMLDPKQEDIIHRLLSSKGNLSFDQLSGRLRFFGPTANSHVYAETSDQFDSREPPEQIRRAERIIRSLSPTTYDYLMDHFWHWYNSVIQVIDRDAFEADRESQNPKFYSSFLHICILAMGYRGADMERDDMKRISLGHKESTLHREAKYMLDIELERPGGIPSVQALLLLGDLECGVGRDNTGWMYSGMSNRLAFDIGLHLDCRNNGMPDQEVQIRRMVMRACVIYDRYWALFLGRPTSIKSQDVGMELLSDKFSMLASDFNQTPERDMVLEIYEQLIELMELAGRILEMRDHHAGKKNAAHLSQNNGSNIFALNDAEDNAYLHVINLDRQLQNWYRRLPDHLAWKPANIKTAPYSFFLLHQQYHVSMILLHRPWAKYDTSDGSSTGSHPSPDANHMNPEASVQHGGLAGAGVSDHSLGMGDPSSMVHDSRASLSRSICTQQAIRVARIFWQHRQRFDGRKIFVTGIQHAGTAVLALVAALGFQRSDSDRRTYLGYLEILSDALADMSHTYHPAGRMDDLLKAVLTQIRLGLGESPRSANLTSLQSFTFSTKSGFSANSDHSAPLIPLRREAAADMDSGYPAKRRRPGNSRRASELPRMPPPFPSMQQRSAMFEESQHQRHGSDVDSMLFSLGITAGTDTMGMGYLHGSAIDMDLGDDRNDMALVTPSSEAWGLGSMHSDHQGQQPTFDPSLSEYAPGPAGLSATGVLGQGSMLSGSHKSTAGMYGLSSKGNTDGLEEGDHSAGVAVMNDPSMAPGMSPVSLAGLTQSIENGTENDGKGGRNHDLDFFSFS